MSRESIEQKVIELCAGTYNKEVSEITLDTRFQEDLSPNSLLRVGLSANIEEELDVMIPLTELTKFKTVGELVHYIEQAEGN